MSTHGQNVTLGLLLLGERFSRLEGGGRVGLYPMAAAELST